MVSVYFFCGKQTIQQRKTTQGRNLLHISDPDSTGRSLVNGEGQKRTEVERAKKKLQGKAKKGCRASVFALPRFCLCGK
jgi:hypothetical protein